MNSAPYYTKKKKKNYYYIDLKSYDVNKHARFQSGITAKEAYIDCCCTAANMMTNRKTEFRKKNIFYDSMKKRRDNM